MAAVLGTVSLWVPVLGTHTPPPGRELGTLGASVTGPAAQRSSIIESSSSSAASESSHAAHAHGARHGHTLHVRITHVCVCCTPGQQTLHTACHNHTGDTGGRGTSHSAPTSHVCAHILYTPHSILDSPVHARTCTLATRAPAAPSPPERATAALELCPSPAQLCPHFFLGGRSHYSNCLGSSST